MVAVLNIEPMKRMTKPGSRLCDPSSASGLQQQDREAQLGNALTDWFLKAIAGVYAHDAEAALRGLPSASD
jgi:hypothetical protein